MAWDYGDRCIDVTPVLLIGKTGVLDDGDYLKSSRC